MIRKPVMSTRDVRFFDAEDGARLPDGLPRRGMSVVSAMSPVLVHENHRASGAWSQTYRRGVPDDELRAVTASTATGTSVTFRVGAEVQGPESLVDSDLAGFPAFADRSPMTDTLMTRRFAHPVAVADSVSHRAGSDRSSAGVLGSW